ncbi:MAG: type IV pilus twitching motility protein PilT [Candidatus Neomarinimicrobiota bacterium]
MQIDDLLRLMIETEASDLHLKVPGIPIFRIDGVLVAAEGYPEVTPEWSKATLQSITNEDQFEVFQRDLELDFSYSIPGLARFRVNASRQRGTETIAFRLINWEIPGVEDLGLPQICKELVFKPRGLVIVTGPTGSGKSTTLASMINHLNEVENKHIITIEDPIEYLFRDKESIISQREIGADTLSFASAMKHALRQDPDVILVGEMRDLETIQAALTGAETGHLVLATLHTPGAAQTVDRIIDVFPGAAQQQIRLQLSNSLEGVIYQELLPRADNEGRVPAVEVMVGTRAVRNLIREDKTHQIVSVIQSGAQHGMQTLDQSLALLVKKRMITLEDASSKSSDPKIFRSLIG